jgi:hypothetical protein
VNSELEFWKSHNCLFVKSHNMKTMKSKTRLHVRHCNKENQREKMRKVGDQEFDKKIHLLITKTLNCILSFIVILLTIAHH